MSLAMQFQETQYFFKAWPWALFTLLSMLGVIGTLVDVSAWLGAPKLSAGGLAATGILIVLVAGIFVMRLDTSADQAGISYRMWPFQQRYTLVRWSDLVKVEVRTYKPIREYGGWGMRVGKNGRALNVWGSRGIQLYFKDGKKLLLGTQKPADWETVLPKITPGNLSK
jgi:hypothetical protein